MLNHIRTLLLNRDGAEIVAPWIVGEEAVDPAYRAVRALPSYLQRVRVRLFGADPDRSFLNYRLAHYTRLLHAVPEVRAYVLAVDPRVTYDGANRSAELFSTTAFTPDVTSSVNNDAGVRLPAVTGTPAAPDLLGRCYHDFEVSVTDASHVQVRQVAPSSKLWNLEVAYAGSLSTSALPLGDSGYGVLMPQSPTGSLWRISFHLRPAWDAGSVAAGVAILGEPTLLGLFGEAPVEPYRTFRDWFARHPELPYRLGGVLLAAAYRTDEVRSREGV